MQGRLLRFFTLFLIFALFFSACGGLGKEDNGNGGGGQKLETAKYDITGRWKMQTADDRIDSDYGCTGDRGEITFLRITQQNNSFTVIDEADEPDEATTGTVNGKTYSLSIPLPENENGLSGTITFTVTALSNVYAVGTLVKRASGTIGYCNTEASLTLKKIDKMGNDIAPATENPADPDGQGAFSQQDLLGTWNWINSLGPDIGLVSLDAQGNRLSGSSRVPDRLSLSAQGAIQGSASYRVKSIRFVNIYEGTMSADKKTITGTGIIYADGEYLNSFTWTATWTAGAGSGSSESSNGSSSSSSGSCSSCSM